MQCLAPRLVGMTITDESPIAVVGKISFHGYLLAERS
jgi:hypothetical protein